MSMPLYTRLATNPRQRSPSSPSYAEFEQEPSHSLPRWRRRWHSTPFSWLHIRTHLRWLKFALAVAVLLVIGVFVVWEPHVEISFYNRAWIRQEIDPVPPLSGCFSPRRVSPLYNATAAAYAQKKTEVHAGLPMRLGLDCYDFAGTIHAEPRRGIALPASQRTQYHTYWRTDLAPFGPRQEWMLKSFFATQDTDATRLVLWSNGDLSHNAILQTWLNRFPDAFELRVADVDELVHGTELEGSEVRKVKDTRAWVDGDLVRLLVLWAYGGVWVDMDSLLTRDLAPILEHEFVTQWDCYDKVYNPFNGALMRFYQHSPYLCEAFHIMATEHAPRQGSTDWGALLYLKLWRRLIAASISPFKVLPFCFTDARSCRLDNRLPDPFAPDPANGQWTFGLGREADGGLDKALGQVFSVHLHNQWEKAYPAGGWVERLLLQKYEERLGGSPKA